MIQQTGGDPRMVDMAIMGRDKLTATGDRFLLKGKVPEAVEDRHALVDVDGL